MEALATGLAVWLAEREYQLLPDQLDVGFVPTASALGGLLGGLATLGIGVWRLARGRQFITNDDLAIATALGAIMGGVAGAAFYILGIAGVPLETGS